MIPTSSTLTTLFFLATVACATVSANPQNHPQSQAMNDLQVLSSEKMQGREPGTAGNRLAQEYIIERLTQLGLKPCKESFFAEFNYRDKRGETQVGKNIVACQLGKTNQAKAIVVSAHYDHLGARAGKIFFGADDNASGVAAVLAIAASMQGKTSAPEHTLVYAFFDGEEIGLLGSNAFVKNETFAKKNIAINLNFDMVARGDKNELYASGSYTNPWLKPLLRHLDGTQGIKLIFGHDCPEEGEGDWTNQSDHYAFFQANIPHLYFGVEDHADYHKTSDRFEKINPKFFDGAIEILSKAVVVIDHAIK